MTGQHGGCRPAAAHVIQQRLRRGPDDEIATIRIDVRQQCQTLRRHRAHHPQDSQAGMRGLGGEGAADHVRQGLRDVSGFLLGTTIGPSQATVR